MHTDFKESFICPISGQIFKQPVLAQDGYFYEKMQIKKWFKNHNTSPMTNSEITTKLQECFIFNSMLEKFLEHNPIERSNQYNEYKNHLEHTEKVNKLIKHNELDKLFKYNNFIVSELFANATLLINLLTNGNNSIIKYFIDNCLDLNSVTNNGWNILHFVIKHCDLEIIKYVIGKDIDPESETKKGWRAIHIACKYSDHEIIEYFLDLNINLESETKNGWRPIHLLCYDENSTIIQYLLSKNINMYSKIRKHHGRDVNYGIKELIIINDNMDLIEKVKLIELIIDTERANHTFINASIATSPPPPISLNNKTNDTACDSSIKIIDDVTDAINQKENLLLTFNP